MLELYVNIRKRREQLSMSQQELADKAGYTSRSSIAKIEAGERDIPQSKIIAFANALQTTPAYLMGWEKEKPASNDEFSEKQEKVIKYIEGLDREEDVDRALRALALIFPEDFE